MDAYKPSVSWVTSTYGRVATLEELINCFLKQEYDGPLDLVILNDHPEQNLIFDHPRVTIINSKERIVPLGKKFNQCIRASKGDVIMLAEDDDIYLPNRTSYCLSKMRNGVYHTNRAFYEEMHQKIIVSGNLFHGTMAFTRKLFESVNGYNEIDKCTVDVEFIEKIVNEIKKEFTTPNYIISWYNSYIQDNIEDKDIFYIYRFATTGFYNGSGWGDKVDNISELATEVLKTISIPRGDIYLEPKWRYNYLDYLPVNK